MLVTILGTILLLILLINFYKQSKKINDSLFSLYSKLNRIEEKIDAIEKQSKLMPEILVEEKQQTSFTPELSTEIIEEEAPLEEKVEIFEANNSEQEAIEKTEVFEQEDFVKETEVFDSTNEEPILTESFSTENYIPKKSWFENFKEKNPDLEKFIGENLINKIGILILVLGISYFVKFAIDKNWINEPARVGIGILAGSLVMAVAHKLKKNFAAFSSVLVAGAVSIFYFTIAIAFHDYQLFSQTVAFAIMVGITAFSVFVSVSYNRQELAVLSLIGGFAVPFMVSTGQGNYVVLFTYIAILNAGILAISYFKKWNIVTVLSFIFTSILFASWYAIEIQNEAFPYSGALLFATLFYFIFSVTIILHNIRKKGTLSYIEYAMLIANNFVFFGLGMSIISNWEINFKGLFTLLLAIYNLIYAFILYSKFKLDKNSIYVLIGLTLTFATLTIPIQFEGNQITIFWAAEAVLLFWLAKKSNIQYFKLSAVIVQFLTIGSLLLDWLRYATETELSILLNPLFISGFVVTLSFVLSYFILKKEQQNTVLSINFNPQSYSRFLAIAMLLCAYLTGFLEIAFQANNRLLNSGSVMAFPVAYHFLFLAVFITFVTKFKNQLTTIITSFVAVFSVFLYIVFFYKLTNIEIFENIIYNDTNYNYAFYLHYITFVALLYIIYQLYVLSKKETTFKFLSAKYAAWCFVFAIVYILSCELLIHGLYFEKNINTSEISKMYQHVSSFNDANFYEKENFVNDQLLTTKQQIIKIGYPILWGVLSFVLLIIGIRKQYKKLRIIALSLLGLTILKLFIYDINNASETGRIIAFILLGVLILIISFVYQKLKKLIIEDEPKTNSNED